MSSVYNWKLKDTVIIDVLFIACFIGIVVLLSMISIFILLIFLIFFVIMNFLLAVNCHDCPHQGKFCPGVSQLLFGALLSNKILKQKEITKRLMRFTLIFYLLVSFGNFIFAFTIIIISLWNTLSWITLIPPLCFLLYTIIAWPILCPKCNYKEDCPVRNYKKFFQY